MQSITPCLWFDDRAEEAAKFYASIFPNSKIGTVAHYSEAAAKASGRPKGSVMTVDFEINGQNFMGLNGGPIFKFSEAVSFVVNVDSQEELDHYWDKLTEGGEESVCGWLKDKFGLSWQIVPAGWDEMWKRLSPEQADRVMQAILQMRKIDIAKVEAAAK
jgi:predicted 3-demethylubiquinone-9 3-methyltransferase (glyoxalase superfamily)